MTPTPPTPPPEPPEHARRRPASLARRAAPAVALLGASAGLLALLDRPPSAPTPSDLALDATTSPTPTSPSTTATSRNGSSSTTPTTTTPATSVSCTGDAVTSPSVATEYGPLQLEATFRADGALCNIDAVATPSNDSKSISINSRAVPILETRAISAQSATFDAVSGATYTSTAYKRALQAILDQR